MSGSIYLTVAALLGAPALGVGVPSPAHGSTYHGGPGVAPVFSSERAVDIPPGTSVPVTIDQDIPINQEQVGQTFTAHVTRDVVVNDKVVVPEGSPAKVKLVPSSEKSDNATLQLTEVRVNGQPQSVQSSDARADTERSHNGLGKKTGIGAAAGAVVGAVTGLGLVKGAIVGAGGGLAWGYFGGSKQIGKDTQLEFSVK
jgi:hypothetical protein